MLWQTTGQSHPGGGKKKKEKIGITKLVGWGQAQTLSDVGGLR